MSKSFPLRACAKLEKMKTELSNLPENGGSEAKGANVSLTCSLTQGGPQDMSSTMGVRNKLV